MPLTAALDNTTTAATTTTTTEAPLRNKRDDDQYTIDKVYCSVMPGLSHRVMGTFLLGERLFHSWCFRIAVIVLPDVP